MRRLLLAVVLVPLAAAVLGAGALAWRLARGPLPVPWLAQRLAAALDDTDAPVAMSLDSASVAWNGEIRRLELRAHGVEVRGRDGNAIATLPTVVVQLRGRALLAGHVAVRAIELAGPRLRIERRPGGALDLAMQDAHGAGDHIPLAASLAQALRRGGLEAVRLRDGFFELVDVASGRHWSARRVDVLLTPRAAGLNAHASLVADLSGEPATAALRASYTEHDDTLLVSDAWLQTADARIALAGRMQRCTGAPRLDATIATERIAATALPRLWPARIAGAARSWVAANLVAGTIAPLQVHVVTAPDDAPRVRVDFGLDDATVRVAGDLPPLRGAHARGTCRVDRCEIDVARGTLSEALALRGRVELTGLGAPEAVVRVAASADGPAGDLLHVLQGLHVGPATPAGLAPESVRGDVQARLAFDLPLRGPARPRIRTVEATLREVGIPRAVGSWDVTGGNFDVAFEGDAVAITGTASLAGVALDVAWREPLGASSRRRQASASGRLDRAHRRALGIDRDWLRGPVDIRVTLDPGRNGDARVLVDADLDDASLALPFAALAKRRGEPGDLHATAVLRRGALLRIEDVAGRLHASTFTGRATLAPDGSRWRTLDIEASLRSARTGDAAARLVLRVEPPPGDGEPAHPFVLTIDDVGRLLEAAGTDIAARGGTLGYAGTARPGEAGLPFDGIIEVEHVTLTRSNLLAKVVTLASIGGVRKALDDEGTTFDDVSGHLAHRAGTFVVHDGLAVGPTLAVHLGGTFDLAADRMDASGDVVPSYWGLNRALDRVPLVGRLAGGDEGLQAFHFTARGRPADPTVRVDPLASLAPGVLRDTLKRLSR